MASGHVFFDSLVFYFLLIFWLLEPTNDISNQFHYENFSNPYQIDTTKLFSKDCIIDLRPRFDRKYGFGPPRRKKYFAARVSYYSNSSSYFQQSRLILLSGDVELNPWMISEVRGNKNVKIGHLNIRSLKNREHYILTRELVTEKEFDIFTISETWLNNLVTDVEVEFPGFNMHRLDRENKMGGGVCAFVRDSRAIKSNG